MVMQDFFEFLGIDGYIHQYARSIAIASLGIGLLVGGYFGLQYYNSSRNQSAIIAYQACLDEYNHAREKDDLWPHVELAAKVGYQQFSNTSFGPYFLGLQADALLEQHKMEEALALLKALQEKLSVRSPLYYNYALKKVLVMLDSSNQAVVQEGLQQLDHLAHDLKNGQRDQALYELAYYYRTINDNAAAQATIKELTSSFPTTGMEGSIWAEQAALLE